MKITERPRDHPAPAKVDQIVAKTMLASDSGIGHWTISLDNGTRWRNARAQAGPTGQIEGAAQEYLSRYGVGLNEARILTVPGLTQTELSVAMAMNKSIVSRSLASLIERELIRQEGTPRALHNYITEAGFLIHDRIVPIALGHEEALLAGVTQDERRQLLQLLARMLKNTENMKA